MNTTELKIRIYGDPCLVKKSSAVKEVGPGERLLIQAMITTMHKNKGLGLSAPQVGINQRIFVVDIGDGPLALINPQILKKSGASLLEEGCLSIPGINVKIKRPEVILVKYLDENNNVGTKEYSNLMARVILHETDHLNGKLILDYVSKKERKKLEEQFQEYIEKNLKDIK